MSRYIKKLSIVILGLLCLVSLNSFSFTAVAQPGVDEDGIYQWTEPWETTALGSTMYINDVVMDANGYVYIVGSFSDTIDFDFGATTTNRSPQGTLDGFVGKYGADGELVWIRTMGGSGESVYVQSVQLDPSGNVYVAGTFTGTVDFDPSTGPVEKTSLGGHDSFVSKILAIGTFSWVRAWGNTEDENVPSGSNSLTVDSSGNTYTISDLTYFEAGYGVDYDDTGGTDTKSTTGDEANLAITKYSTAGAYVSTTILRGTFYNLSLLTAGINGSTYYLGGSLAGTLDFDPGAGTASKTGTGEHFIAKYDTSLTYGWVKVFEGGDYWGDTYSPGLIATSTGVYMTGAFQGSADFDPDGAGDVHDGGLDSTYITSYLTAGTYSWTGTIGTSGGYQIDYDSNGDILVSGWFGGSVDFDPGAGTHTAGTSGGAYILKLNSDNTFSWVRTIEGVVGDDTGLIDSQDPYVNIIGRFTNSTVDFNDNPDLTDEYTATGTYMFVTEYQDVDMVSITGLSADLDAIEFYNDIDAEIPSSDLVDTAVEIVLKDHATGNPLAHAVVDMTESRDWSTVVGVHNGTTGKTYIDNLDTAPGVSDFQLYVKKTTGTNGVLVCPDAASISDVTELCTNGYSLTASSGDATIQDMGGVDYWRVYALLGEDNVGGMPVTLTPPGPFIGSTTDGVYQWTVALGSTGYDYGFSTVEDLDGNIYATGLFAGTVDFDPGSGTANKVANDSYDTYLAKYDSDGNFLWVRTWGGVGVDRGYSVDVDTDNNVLVSGNFSGTVDFDDSGGTANRTSASPSAYLVKYTSTGVFGWVRAWGTAGSHSVEHTIDSSNNIYVATDCSGSVDFDDAGGADTLSCTAGDLAITSYNTDGSYGDTFLMPASDFASITDIERYGSYIYVGGRFTGTVDFDPAAGTEERTTVGGYDGFLAQYTTSGTLNWVRQFGSDATDDVWGIAADDDVVYATGNFASTLNFDPNGGGDYWYPGISSTAGFLTSYDASGIYNWTKAFRGNSVVEPRAATTDSNGNIYVGGTFWGTPDFDSDDGVATPDVDYTGMFFLKYNYDGSFAWVRTTSGDVDGNASVEDIRFGSGNSTYITGFYASTFEFSDEPGISDIYSSSGGSNDLFITKFDDLNKVNIESLAAPLDATDIATGRDAEVESAFIYGAGRTVRLESASGSQPLSDVTTDLTTTRNWSGVSASNDSVLGKAVVNNLSSAPGASATQTIYIPKLAGHNYVYICPDATSLAGVTTSCSGGYVLSDASAGVSIVNIGGADYWKVESVSDVGGVSIASIPASPYVPPYYGDTGVIVPVIDFTIDDYIVAEGDTITLTWSTTGLTELKLYLNDELYGILELSGTLELIVEEETEAKLVGTGPNGSLERTFIIALIEEEDVQDGEPTIRYFIVTADTSTWPVKVTIKWLVDNVDSVDISGLGDNLAPEGQSDVFITEDTEFVLEANSGVDTATVTRKILVPPRIEATMNTIISAIPLTIALSTALAASAVTAASSGGVATATMINRIGVILGIVTPKKKKTWGFVYDLSTYKPVPFVTIRLLQNGKIVDQTVSQLDGKYGIPVARAGTYLLELKALGFRPITEEITVSALDSTKEVVKDLALQRTDKGINVFNYLIAYLKPELVNAVRAISTILFVVGMGISIWATVQTPSTLNYILILFYGFVILWNIVAFIKELSLRTGSITDSTTGKGIKGAVIRIISPKDGQVGAYMTNSEGKIKFDLPAGRYGYTVARNGYQQIVGNDQLQIREDGYMSAPIRIEAIQSDITSNRELSNPFQG